MIITYSVGTNSGALYSGNASSTSNVLTLASAASANIGIGDQIRHGSNRYYITGRNSPTSFNIATATGGSVTDFSSTAITIYRAYNSISAAEAGASDASHLNTSDLVASNFLLQIACYADGNISGSTDVDGWTVDATRYVRFFTPVTLAEVGITQRHSGVWDETKFYMSGAPSAAFFTTNDNYVRIEGFQFNIASSDQYRYGVRTNTSNGVRILSNIMKQSGTGTNQSGVYATGGGTDVVIANNIIYGFSTANSAAFALGSAASGGFAYNNTAYGCVIGMTSGYLNIVAKNNICYNNTTDFGSDFAAASTNNLSKDATAPALNTYYRNKTVAFVNTAGNDYRLSIKDTDAKDLGANLSADGSYAFSDDITGTQRPIGSAWDIGADEAKYFGNKSTYHRRRRS